MDSHGGNESQRACNGRHSHTASYSPLVSELWFLFRFGITGRVQCFVYSRT